MKELYKMKYDGSHYIATKKREGKSIVINGDSLFSRMRVRYIDIEERFIQAYYECAHYKYKGSERYRYILDVMYIAYGDDDIDMTEYVGERIEYENKKLHRRLNVFKSKVLNNRWNYFVTLTRDNNKCTEFEFRVKVTKVLSNLSTREGWKYAGAFEYSPSGRLHFHAFIYVPNGHMMGVVRSVTEYNRLTHSMDTHHANSYFTELFGRNDFDRIYNCEIERGNSINYITKYISKTGARVQYSKGLPDSELVLLDEDDIICYFDYKYNVYALLDDYLEIVDKRQRWRYCIDEVA